MELEELLERQDIPKDVKEVIQRGIDKIKQIESKFQELEEKNQHLAKQAEKTLEESKVKYRMIVEKMQEGVLLEDVEGNITFVNPRTAELLGYTEDELLGKHWSYISAVQDLDKFKTESAKRPKGITSTYEANTLTKEGHLIPVIITATPIFDKKREFKGVLSVYIDITKRKEAEQKLRESEEQYRSYVENARDLIFTISPDGIITSINSVMEFIAGWPQNEWIGKPFSPLVHTDDLPNIIDGFQRVLEGERLPPPEMRLLTKSGDYVTVEIKASPQIKDGKVIGMLGIARNIEERRLAEEALRESEEKYRTLVTNSLQGLVIAQGIPPRLTFVNNIIAEILGYSVQEMLNFQPEELTKIVHPEDREMFFQRYRDRLAGNPVTSQYEVRGVRKDGSVRWLEIFSSRIEYLGEPAVQDAFIDITERKQALAALQQVKTEEERYHAMLSHFLNNDLQKIINNLDFLSLGYEYDQVFKDEIVHRIINIASRSSNTIDSVNKIFEILQSSFDRYKEKLKLLDVINGVTAEIVSPYPPIEIKNESLDLIISADKHLKDTFNELLVYILNSCTKDFDMKIPIIIEGSHLPSYFRVSIRDPCTQPISEEICLRLSRHITDEWEYQGHYIGISLASVIMQHYSGSLKIHPSEPKGNIFHLNFPLKMIEFQKD